MSHLMVMVQSRAGLLVPCPATQQSDGAIWHCAICGELCIRVAFGVMSGLWRCKCGAEVQFLIDGRLVDPREIQPFEPVEQQPAEPKPKRPRKKRIKSDKDFLTQCGIRPLSEEEKP